MKKSILFVFTILLTAITNFAQVAINTNGTTAATSAMLDVSSTSGGILIPRVTTAQRTAIPSPATSLLVYDTDKRSFWYYKAVFLGVSSWTEIAQLSDININDLTDGIYDGSSLFFGNNAGVNDDATQNQNTAVGTNTLQANNTGSDNAAYGHSTMRFNTTGISNSAYGTYSSYNNTSGNANSAYGAYSSYNNTSGNANAVLGYETDYFNDGGSQNTIIGYQAGRATSSHSKSGSIFLGYQAGYNETGDDKLYIENSNSATPLIGGDFAANEVYINDRLGIGTSSPYAPLDVKYSLSVNSINPVAIFQTSGSGISAAPIRVKNSAGEQFNFGITPDPDNAFAIAYSNNIGMGSDLFRLSSTGNLAIGSHTAQEKLDIDGQIRIRGGVPGNGKILTSDALGTATWEVPQLGAAELGDLSNASTQNLSMFIGDSAGTLNTGSHNTGIGMKSMQSNTTGNNNTTLGKYSLKLNESGSSNIAIGYNSLLSNVTTSNNCAIGFSALMDNTGSSNIAIGSYAAKNNTAGEANVVVGYASNYLNETGSNNTLIGHHAGRGVGATLHNKSGNIFLGYEAGYSETGSNKLYIENSNSSAPLIGGDFAADEVYINGTIKITGGTPGANKVLTSDASGNATWEASQAGATEINELSDGISDGFSLFLGEYAGENDNGENDNVGIGYSTLNANTGGARNTAVGFTAIAGGTLGTDNTAVGNAAMYSNFSGNYNAAIGSLALYNISTGTYNTAVGYKSAYNTTSGEYNTAIGNQSLRNNVSGDVNTAIGQFALIYNTGDYNTALGGYASKRNTTGNNNVTLGYAANYNNQTGDNNTIIGYEAGRSASTHNKNGNVFIGYKAGYDEVGDNKLYIENSNSANPLIGGDFSVDEVYINGTIKITGGSPGAGKVLTSDASGNATWVAPAPIVPSNELIIELQAAIEMLKKEIEMLKNQ